MFQRPVPFNSGTESDTGEVLLLRYRGGFFRSGLRAPHPLFLLYLGNHGMPLPSRCGLLSSILLLPGEFYMLCAWLGLNTGKWKMSGLVASNFCSLSWKADNPPVLNGASIQYSVLRRLSFATRSNSEKLGNVRIAVPCATLVCQSNTCSIRILLYCCSVTMALGFLSTTEEKGDTSSASPDAA